MRSVTVRLGASDRCPCFVGASGVSSTCTCAAWLHRALGARTGQRGPVVGNLAEPPLQSGGAGLAARVDTPAGRARVSRLYISQLCECAQAGARTGAAWGARALEIDQPATAGAAIYVHKSIGPKGAGSGLSAKPGRFLVGLNRAIYQPVTAPESGCIWWL